MDNVSDQESHQSVKDAVTQRINGRDQVSLCGKFSIDLRPFTVKWDEMNRLFISAEGTWTHCGLTVQLFQSKCTDLLDRNQNSLTSGAEVLEQIWNKTSCTPELLRSFEGRSLRSEV